MGIVGINSWRINSWRCRGEAPRCADVKPYRGKNDTSDPYCRAFYTNCYIPGWVDEVTNSRAWDVIALGQGLARLRLEASVLSLSCKKPLLKSIDALWQGAALAANSTENSLQGPLQCRVAALGPSPAAPHSLPVVQNSGRGQWLAATL